jgi:hypothetical protein
MQRDQQATPLPPDPPGREDIVSGEQREEDPGQGNREDAPLPRDPVGPEDTLGSESQERPIVNG